MIEPSSRAPDLEAGLAELDRRLREIQDELVREEQAEPAPEPRAEPPLQPRAEPPLQPRAEPPPTQGQGRDGPLAAVLKRASVPRRREAQSIAGIRLARERLDALERELDALAGIRDSLLASIRGLLEGYEAAADLQAPSPRRRAEHAEPSEGPEVTLSAGPFASLDDVRAFERTIAALPGVHRASLRGYEGEDRAIVDVFLARGVDARPSEHRTS